MTLFYLPNCETVCVNMVSDFMTAVSYGVHFAIENLGREFDPICGMETADNFLLWFIAGNLSLLLWKSFAVNSLAFAYSILT